MPNFIVVKENNEFIVYMRNIDEDTFWGKDDYYEEVDGLGSFDFYRDAERAIYELELERGMR